jgi:hypothetical protein
VPTVAFVVIGGRQAIFFHQPAARRGRLVADRLFITQPALTAPPATSGAAEIAR